jgi:hypothetical protein
MRNILEKKISLGHIFMLVFINLYQFHLQLGNNQKNGLQESGHTLRQLKSDPS